MWPGSIQTGSQTTLCCMHWAWASVDWLGWCDPGCLGKATKHTHREWIYCRGLWVRIAWTRTGIDDGSFSGLAKFLSPKGQNREALQPLLHADVNSVVSLANQFRNETGGFRPPGPSTRSNAWPRLSIRLGCYSCAVRTEQPGGLPSHRQDDGERREI